MRVYPHCLFTWQHKEDMECTSLVMTLDYVNKVTTIELYAWVMNIISIVSVHTLVSESQVVCLTMEDL